VAQGDAEDIAVLNFTRPGDFLHGVFVFCGQQHLAFAIMFTVEDVAVVFDLEIFKALGDRVILVRDFDR